MKINNYLENEFKEGVNFLLEATNCESFLLWEKDKHLKRCTQGIGINVGDVNGDYKMPIWVCIGISNYKGFKYLEYEVTSRFVDHNIVDEWLSYHFKDIPKTNANNIHILKHAADKWLDKQNETL